MELLEYDEMVPGGQADSANPKPSVIKKKRRRRNNILLLEKSEKNNFWWNAAAYHFPFSSTLI